MRHTHTAAHATEPYTSHPFAHKALCVLLALVMVLGCSPFVGLGEVYADDSTSSDIYLKAAVTLSDQTIQATQFSFVLADEEGEVVSTANNDVDGNITFDAISYDAAGSYSYSIYQVDAGEDCYDIDDAVFSVTVTVTEAEDGTLASSASYYDAEGKQVEVATFENAYYASGSLELTAFKTLLGRALTEGEFSFLVSDADGKALATGVSDADGLVSFSAIAYDQSDIGNTYTYYVSEVTGTDSTVVYDDAIFTYEVEVVDDGDGSLSFDVDMEDNPLFENELQDGTLSIAKTISSTSDDAGLTSEFTFYVQLIGLPEDFDEDEPLAYTLYDASGNSYSSATTVTDSDDDASALSLATVSTLAEADGDGSDSTSDEVIASGLSGTCSWYIDGNGVLYIYPTNGVEGYMDSTTDTGSAPWSGWRTEVTEVVIDEGAHAGADAAYMFYGCVNMERLSGDGAKTFVTSTTTDLQHMFQNCASITKLSINDWDVSEVTTLYDTFYNCTSLETLEVSEWNTGSVTAMNYAFDACTSLKALDINDWNVKNVTTISHMFTYCLSLQELDLSEWEIDNLTTMGSPFTYCAELQKVDLSGWNTSTVTSYGSDMFTDCHLLDTVILGSGWTLGTDMLPDPSPSVADGWTSSTTDNVTTYTWNYVDGYTTEPSGTSGGCTWKIDDGVLTISPMDEDDVPEGETQGYLDDCTDAGEQPWSGHQAEITSVVIKKGVYAQDAAYLFIGCSLMTSFSGDGAATFITSETTTMDYMFYDCASLASLDVSNWDTSSVKTMNYAFKDCASLTELDLSAWKVTSLTSLEYTFMRCPKLVTVNMSSWDTDALTSLYGTFNDCLRLKNIYVNGEDWDTSKVTNFYQTFGKCSSLETLDISNWSTSSAEVRDGTFLNCSSLSSITLGSGWTWTYTDDEGTATVTTESEGALPTPPTYLPYYGEWVATDGTATQYGSMTAAELASAWDGETYAGTWVWATKDGVSVSYSANASSYSGAMADELWTYDADSTVADNAYYRLGYEFTGWSTAADGSGDDYAAGATVTDDEATYMGQYEGISSITLYAQWDPVDTTVNVKNGIFSFTLHGYETAKFTLPAGVGYLVYEQTASGWELVSSSGTTGEITPVTTSAASFENNSPAESTSSTTAYLTASVTMDGSAADEGEFDFALYDSDGNEVDTTSNVQGGAIVFDGISYDEAGTYTYTIKQIIPEEGGDTINYDSQEYTATVTVSEDDEGSLSSSVSYADYSGEAVAAATFANSTKTGYLSITKAVNGGSADDVFYADLICSDGTSETVTLSSSNNYTWTSGEIAAGTTYRVTETDIPDGYLQTGSENASGTIAGGATTTCTLTNTYVTATWAASANKTLTTLSNVEVEMEGGDYDFVVADDDGNVVATGTNAADGTVSFSDCTFGLDDAGKTYSYSIYEVEGEDADCIYDDAVYTVQVVVSEASDDGTIELTTTYYDADGNALTGDDGEAAAPTFENVFNHLVSLPQTGSGGIVGWLVGAFALLAVSGAALVVNARSNRARRSLRSHGSHAA